MGLSSFALGLHLGGRRKLHNRVIAMSLEQTARRRVLRLERERRLLEMGFTQIPKGTLRPAKAEFTQGRWKGNPVPPNAKIAMFDLPKPEPDHHAACNPKTRQERKQIMLQLLAQAKADLAQVLARNPNDTYEPEEANLRNMRTAATLRRQIEELRKWTRSKNFA